MIVNVTAKGWDIIYQRAHGLLAAKIGSFWQENDRPERWHETLTAITEHDDGQEGWNHQVHITELGVPMDFSLKEFSLEQAQNIARISQYKSVWIALLISKHLSYLYEPLRGQEKEIDDFLDQQKENQKQWRKDLKLKVAQIDAAYRLVHWCDRCSLILCREKIPEDEREVEVFELPNGEKSYLWQRENGEIGIRPWIFEPNSFSVNVEVRHLEHLKYEKDEDLAEALSEAKIEVRTWKFSKS